MAWWTQLAWADCCEPDPVSGFAAADKVSEVQSRIVSGQGLLNEGSSALTALQSSVNSTSSPVAGLLDTVLDALSGASSSSSSSSSGDASNPLASLESSSSLPSKRRLV